jgi:uncharacterized low-complexity protein
MCTLTADALDRVARARTGLPTQARRGRWATVPTLLASASRAGLLMHHWQPGGQHPITRRPRRAELGGFCVDIARTEALVQAATEEGLSTAVHTSASGKSVNARAHAGDLSACGHDKPGHSIPRDVVLREVVRDCGVSGQIAILDAWQVCIADPVPGRTELLIAALTKFATQPLAHSCTVCGRPTSGEITCGEPECLAQLERWGE